MMRPNLRRHAPRPPAPVDNPAPFSDSVAIQVAQPERERIFEEPFEPEEPDNGLDIVGLLSPGQAKPLRETDIADAAADLGCDVAALKAVLEVEARGEPFDRSGFPKIRPELHKFHQMTGDKYALQRFPPESAPRARFEHMVSLDPQAAMWSTSWGIGQVMGFNHEVVGCATLEQLVAEAKESAAKQLRHMVAFIKRQNLDGHLRAHDWALFARGYNGPAFRRLDYDGKLARAYQRIAGGPSWTIIEFGSSGPAVERLQEALNKSGFSCATDGHFGAETEWALREFQRNHGLDVDGVAGTRTWTALAQAADARPDRDTTESAERPTDDMLDDASKAVGVGSGIAALNSSGWILYAFGSLIIVAIAVFLWRKYMAKR